MTATRAVCQGCSDRDLIVDHVPTTCADVVHARGLACAEWFCAQCPYAHVCDATCGYCEDTEAPARECDEGAVLDCSGRCVSATECALGTFQYTRCSDWLANGCCDDGLGYRSDAGYAPNFNCPMHQCDGGDCETCGSNPSGERPRVTLQAEPSSATPRCRDLALWDPQGSPVSCSELLASSHSCETDFCDTCWYAGACDATCGLCDVGAAAAARDPRTEPPQSPGPQPANASPGWCVLVTATVCPAQGMTHTVRWSPRVREKDYGAALQQWTAPSGGTALPVVVVENSGASLRGLRSATSEHARRSGQVEFVSFHDAQHDPTRGKGNAEYHSLLHALNRSQTLRRCTHVLKVTGRYFIENLDEALATLSPEVKLAVQSTPSPWTLWDGVVRSEVVGFANDAGLVQELFDGQHEGRGEPMERVLFLAARRLQARGDLVAKLPALRVPPTRNAENVWVEEL